MERGQGLTQTLLTKLMTETQMPDRVCTFVVETHEREMTSSSAKDGIQTKNNGQGEKLFWPEFRSKRLNS